MVQAVFYRNRFVPQLSLLWESLQEEGALRVGHCGGNAGCQPLGRHAGAPQ